MHSTVGHSSSYILYEWNIFHFFFKVYLNYELNARDKMNASRLKTVKLLLLNMI